MSLSDGDTARQEAQYRRTLIDAAVADGRIPESRRAFWTIRLRRDPEAAAVLDQLTAVGPGRDDVYDQMIAQLFG